MKKVSLEQELKGNAYPGRGIVIGRSKDGTKAVAGYFIMGRSQNSRNRVFVEEGEGIRTQAFDPLNSLFAAVSLSRMHRTTLLVFPV